MNSDDQSLSNRITFESVPEWNRNLALAKYDFLDLAEKNIKELEAERGKTGALKSFLHQFNCHFVGEEIRVRLRRKKVQLDTFYRWSKAFKEYGLDGLLEKHHGSGLRIDPEVREKIELLICKNHLCRFSDIFNDLPLFTDKNKIPSYSAIRVYAKQYREANWASLVLMHEGRKGLRDRNMELVLGRKDEDLTAPNQRWEIDTTLADLMTEREVKDVSLITSDGKRCKVIGVIDVFPRSLKFLLTERETGLAVGQLLKDRIQTWGLPEEVVIDNGRPFKNRRILGFLRRGGISVHICIPGNPVEKPFIERAFRTLTEEVFRRLDGYTGNCVANRPGDIEVKLSMAELQQVIDRYVASIYDERIHGTTGQRPRERRNPPGFVPKTVKDERMLDILLMEEYTRTVSQGHILYLGHRYYHKSLPEGQEVKFRVDDSDASQLLVYHQGKYLCTAIGKMGKGIKPSEIREARKQRNRELKTRVKAHEALLDKYDQVETGLLAQIDAAEKKKPLMLPRKGEVVDFPDLREVVKEIRVVEPEETLITSADAKYLDVMRRKLRGETLSERDSRFLERFMEDDHYQLILPSLDEQLRDEMEAANA